MGLFSKLFGTYSDKEIKRITPIVNEIESLADKFHDMSDDELRGYTDVLKSKLADGKTLDDILPEAFALVREADERVLGKRPFRVQLIGGILLHQGRIAEMRTGEGKTLVATLPAYLNALTGEGVHIVTVNDYLARCGHDEMGRVYGYLGLKTGIIVHGQDPDEKREAYRADITYCTNNELGFDYLRDNMVVYKERMVQRGHAFAIIDEVDSILIDEARTPLIISGQSSKSTELYERADALVRKMSRHVIKEVDKKQDLDTYDEDFIVDEKARTAVLTAHGIEKAEKYFGLENLSDPENATIYHHVNVAIKAHGVMRRDTDYIVKDNSVIIVDTFTGRLMPGRRYNEGLHQAIEAKEHVEVQKESRTVATITFQNYFRMYKKLSGMTGTALTEEDEFRDIYKLDVVEVPTNKPMIRIDQNDLVYRSRAGKLRAIVKDIARAHAKGQPVLVGTVSIEKSELLSKKLKAAKIPHTVLNAKYHDIEADIVAQAGKFGAVTISTNMAGRGTDIMLGGNAEYLAKAEMRREGYEEAMIALATGSSESVSNEVLEARAHYRELYKKYQEMIKPEADRVREAGGLFVIGTERHESRRIDNQLRGRSGRQGDPGESRFFLSFEDDLMRLFGSDRIVGMVERLGLDEDTPIDAKILSGTIESAQKRLEDQNFNRRKNVLSYDDVMNQQRTIIYKQRSEVLDNADLKEKIAGMINGTLDDAVDSYLHEQTMDMWDLDGLRARYMGLLCMPDDFTELPTDPAEARETVRKTLKERADLLYASKEKLFGEEEMREIERIVLLQNVDKKWMEHLESMDSLMEMIGLQAYAQRNPISEYRLHGADMFDEMIMNIRDDTVRMILSIRPRPNREMKRVEVARPVSAGFANGEMKKPVNKPIVNKGAKVGRNDPCPCGSGKKYKKCCGAAGGGAGEDSAN